MLQQYIVSVLDLIMNVKKGDKKMNVYGIVDAEFKQCLDTFTEKETANLLSQRIIDFDNICVSSDDAIGCQTLIAMAAQVSGWTPIFIICKDCLLDTILGIPMWGLSFHPEGIPESAYEQTKFKERMAVLNQLTNVVFIIDCNKYAASSVMKELSALGGKFSSKIYIVNSKDPIDSEIIPDMGFSESIQNSLQDLDTKQLYLLSCILLSDGEISRTLIKDGIADYDDADLEVMIRKNIVYENVDGNIAFLPAIRQYTGSYTKGEDVDPFLVRLWSCMSRRQYADYELVNQVTGIFCNAAQKINPKYYEKAAKILDNTGHMQLARQYVQKWNEYASANEKATEFQIADANFRDAISQMHSQNFSEKNCQDAEEKLWKAIKFNDRSVKKIRWNGGIPIKFVLARLYIMTGRPNAANTLCEELLRTEDPLQKVFCNAGAAYVYVNIDDALAYKYATAALDNLDDRSTAVRDMCILTLCSCSKEVPTDVRIKYLSEYLDRTVEKVDYERRAFLLVVLAEAYEENEDWVSAISILKNAIFEYEKILPDNSKELYFDYKKLIRYSEKADDTDTYAYAMQKVLTYELVAASTTDEISGKYIQLADSLVYQKKYREASSALINALELQIRNSSASNIVQKTIEKLKLVDQMY